MNASPRNIAVGFLAVIAMSLGWMMWGPSHNASEPVPRGPMRTQSVIVAPAISRTATEYVSSVGTTRANKAVIITSKVTGRLEDVFFEDGQDVKTGDVLVTLDSRELEAELKSAEVQLTQVQQEFDRVMSLRGSQAVSESRAEELTAQLGSAEAQVAARAARLEEFTIRAPFAGTLGVNRLSRGTLISQSTEITTLDDLSLIKVDFTVPETVMLKTSQGDQIRATSRALEGFAVEGSIESLETRIDPVNRTIGAVAVFDNQDRLLRPGMFLNLTIALQEKENAIFVAEEALAPSGARQFVYVINDKNVAEKREVTLGLREPGLVEIVSGVAAGELIVVRGIQFMREGSPVEILETIAPGSTPSYQQS